MRRADEQTSASEPHSGLQAKLALAAIKGKKHFRNWRSCLMCTPIRLRSGRASFWKAQSGSWQRGEGRGRDGYGGPEDLHAKIGQLTLENDFLEGALTKGECAKFVVG